MASSDMHSLQADYSYYPIAGVCCCFWLALYKFISPKLSEIFLPAYKMLPVAKQVEWNTRIVSDVHSILASVMCFYCLLFDETISKDPLWADSKLVKMTCSMVIGYMMSDFIVMVFNYSAVGEIFFIFHHLASIYAYYFVITYSSLCWFANFRMIAEFSTPFVNQRWFLDVLGYPKTSPLFMLNGVAMSVMFFVVRILSIPPYWYKVWTFYGTEGAASLGSIWYVLLSSCVLLDSINLYWFSKIYRGAKKILMEKQKLDSKIKGS